MCVNKKAKRDQSSVNNILWAIRNCDQTELLPLLEKYKIDVRVDKEMSIR